METKAGDIVDVRRSDGTLMSRFQLKEADFLCACGMSKLWNEARCPDCTRRAAADRHETQKENIVDALPEIMRRLCDLSVSLRDNWGTPEPVKNAADKLVEALDEVV